MTDQIESDSRVFAIHPRVFKIMLKEAHPCVFILHSAGWRNGYTVNGVRP